MNKKIILTLLIGTLLTLSGCSSQKRNIPWGSNLMHRNPNMPDIDMDYMTSVQSAVENMVRDLLPDSIVD